MLGILKFSRFLILIHSTGESEVSRDFEDFPIFMI